MNLLKSPASSPAFATFDLLAGRDAGALRFMAFGPFSLRFSPSPLAKRHPGSPMNLHFAFVRDCKWWDHEPNRGHVLHVGYNEARGLYLPDSQIS